MKKFDFSKQWPMLFGGFFFTLMMIYVIKVLVEQDLIPDPVKLVGSIAVSVLLFLIGQRVTKRITLPYAGDILQGMGFVGLIFTWMYGAISLEYWDLTLSSLLIASSSAALVFYTMQTNQRMLANLAQMGIWMAPFTADLQTESGYWLAMVYAVALNVAMLYVSHVKNWSEIRIVAQASSLLLLIGHQMSVSNDPVFTTQTICFVILAFLIQMASGIVAYVSSKPNQVEFVVFSVLSVIVGQSSLIHLQSITELPSIHSIALAVYTVFTLGFGMYVFHRHHKHALAELSLILGFVYAIATLYSINDNWELKTHFVMIIMNVLIGLMLFIGHKGQLRVFGVLGLIIWIYVILYGAVSTWSAPVGEWGIYMPVLNWGGMAWLSTCLIALVYHRINEKELSAIATVIGFIVFGIFLYIQTKNGFDAYGFDQKHLGLVMSMIYGLYAAGLFMWSVASRIRYIEILSAIMLVIVALKALFIDLWDSSSLSKIILFAILGALSFGMMMYRQKKQQEGEIES